MKRACGCDPMSKTYCTEGARLHDVIRMAYGRLVDSLDDKYTSTRGQWEKAYDRAKKEWLAHISERGAS